jgi:alanyl-tRNA synthetase
MKIHEPQPLRELFLKFLQAKGHTIIPSAPVVPQNDPSILFTTAGMHPLVPYLLGEEHPGGKRVADIQKCIRTNDIDEVGDNRHLTFFEMMGYWSFGDYFKEQAISQTFEFLTGSGQLDIDPATVYVSVFRGDDDVPRDDVAIEAWRKVFRSHATKPTEAEFEDDVFKFGGNAKIFAYGRDKNWWQAGDTGPAGSDTELFVDTEHGLPDSARVKHEKWQGETGSLLDCHINCDCGRFIEICNNVFMEFNGLGGGKYEPLSQKNVDMGMGFERLLTFTHGQQSVFDTALFAGAFEILAAHGQAVASTEPTRRERIIVDHLRAATFIANDGIVPANKDRGYILRRLLRRAFVHGKLLGLHGEWVNDVVSWYIASYAAAYPELAKNSQHILATILEEDQRFAKTLEAGLKEFYKFEHVTGKDAFNLFQSFGIPWEITRELAEQQGIAVDREEFEAEFKKHQELSRTSSAGTFKGGLADHSDVVVRYHTATHLLQAALRRVLGDHVQQRGSNITQERMRFDFTQPEKMTPGQVAETEKIVNDLIAKDLTVTKTIMTPDEARALGAIGLFGEKYGDTVSVYTVADSKGVVYSREFCGGPHVEHTGTIGTFKVTKEEAVSAGVRRIKATIS